jgi:anti-anti-sigma regulatory factor
MGLLRTGESSLALSGEVTVYEVSALKAGLLELAVGPAWQCDLSGLEAIDVAGAQLLVSFQRSRPGVAFHGLPERLQAQLAQAGLLELFDFAEAA